MKLTSFQIENFRSIPKARCDISSGITIFAGKNESGKTNVLDALTLLNDNIEITDEDIPTYLQTDHDMIITCNFELANDEKEELRKSIPLTTQTPLPSEITIKYFPKEKQYEISGEAYSKISASLDFTKSISEINTNLTAILLELRAKNIELPITLLNDVSDEGVKKTIDELRTAQSKIPRIAPTPEQPQPVQDQLIKKISEIIPRVQSQTVLPQMAKVDEKLWSMRPKVIFFSSFEDTLPHEVPYQEFIDPVQLKSQHRIVFDLVTLAELDLAKVRTENKLARHNVTRIASAISTKKFSEFWDQNQIEFVFDVDQKSASIFIRDQGKSYVYKPEQRSEGFQWFISFYLRLEAAGTEKNNIILVDEPGLYLHSKAQKNVLTVFERLAKSNQILFTTHSPYLIDPDNLNRVRLVIKDDDKTVIKNNFQEGGTDFDTLTPIITAIGLDITKDLFFSKMGYNVLTEGVSDYYYIRGMIEYLQKYEKHQFPEDITFIPCFGHATVSVMLSFLLALGLKYKILLDRKGTGKTISRLKDDGVRDEEILFSGKKSDESIEDLFDPKDRAVYCTSSTNQSKGIIARDFYEKSRLEKIPLEKNTISQFTQMIDEIKKEILIKTVVGHVIDSTNKNIDVNKESNIKSTK